MHQFVAGRANILNLSPSDHRHDVALLRGKQRDSRTYAKFPKGTYYFDAYESHTKAIWAKGYHWVKELPKFFKITGASYDESGNDIATSVEAHHYPIYGFLYHF